MDKTDKAIYSGLPSEVTQIGHLIGLEKGALQQSEKIIKEFVTERVDKKQTSEDFKYKIYNLYETIDNSGLIRKKPKKKLNCKQKKALFNIKNEKFLYNDFLKINKLWHSYFESIVSDIKSTNDELMFARADYHGAELEVYASKNITTVGCKGLVLQESKNAFKLINKQNKLLTIPKCGTVFSFNHNGRQYRLNGYSIQMTSFNRSKIKPKFAQVSDL